jgi:hypothetical protein
MQARSSFEFRSHEEFPNNGNQFFSSNTLPVIHIALQEPLPRVVGSPIGILGLIMNERRRQLRGEWVRRRQWCW